VGCEELRAYRVTYAIDVLDVRSRDHEHMSGVAGLTELIEERYRAHGLVDDVGRPSRRDDLAEHTGIHNQSLRATRSSCAPSGRVYS